MHMVRLRLADTVAKIYNDGSEDVARLYAQLGFEPVTTSCIAEARQG